MLKKLSEKDQLWREIAFNICRDRNQADDLVNEMYLRRYDNDRGQPTTDYYIACTMQSIFLNNKKTDKLIPVGHIRTNDTVFVNWVNGGFEPNDKEHELLEKAKKLPFYKRELIEINYDYSLREIQNKYGVSYGYVHKIITEARKEILGKEIYKYNNKRLKHKKMNQSIGLGDTVEKLTRATGIKKIVDKISGDKDCGCEKRKEFLNRLWQYKLKPKCLTSDEINDYHNFINTRKVFLQGNGKAVGKLSKKDVKFVCDFYGIVFKVNVPVPDCTSCHGTASKLIDMIYKLDTVFVNNVPSEPEKKPRKTRAKRKPNVKNKIMKKEEKEKDKKEKGFEKLKDDEMQDLKSFDHRPKDPPGYGDDE